MLPYVPYGVAFLPFLVCHFILQPVGHVFDNTHCRCVIRQSIVEPFLVLAFDIV